MPSRNLYSFDIEGIESMILTLERIEQETYQKIEDVLTRLAEKVIEDAKRLAPLDSGDLEAALVVADVKKMLQRIYIDFGTSPEVDDYALVQHEGFRKTKSGAVVQMSPGEKTASKGPHKGHMPGKKFLENAIKINEELITRELRTALRF
jgi:HK97 gp10 family phage protein